MRLKMIATYRSHSREWSHSLCEFWSDKWHNRRWGMATWSRQLLVQYCIILNHISHSLWANKKESTNFDALCICEGDLVSVENHGKHWIHLGHIISINKNIKLAAVKWEETRKKDTVHLGDCKKYNKLDVIPRKPKSTDFFCEIPQTKRGKPPPG